MNYELAIDIFQTLIITGLMLVSPLLGTAIGVGLVISILQTVTSIQEQTLSFVPKLVGVGLMLIVSSHWMVRTLVDFSAGMIQRMSQMAP